MYDDALRLCWQRPVGQAGRRADPGRQRSQVLHGQLHLPARHQTRLLADQNGRDESRQPGANWRGGVP